MIYTVSNTLYKGKPIQVYLDGVRIPQMIYLDRRRHIYRKFKTNETGSPVLENGTVPVEECRYGRHVVVRIERPKPTTKKSMRVNWFKRFKWYRRLKRKMDLA